MAPPKRRAGGRVTPKGTRPGDRVTGVSGNPAPSGGSSAAAKGGDGPHHANTASSRYTPPVSKQAQLTPRWVPFVMWPMLAAGPLLIIINYLGGGISNWLLIIGLGLILVGIMAATQYR